jgi:hypothetical protein
MQALVEGWTIVCALTGERSRGRRVGTCMIDGHDIGGELIEAGLALWRHPYSLVLLTVQLKQSPPLPRPSVRLLEFGKAGRRYSVFSRATRMTSCEYSYITTCIQVYMCTYRNVAQRPAVVDMQGMAEQLRQGLAARILPANVQLATIQSIVASSIAPGRLVRPDADDDHGRLDT